jgi:hypothetical protein
LAIEASSFFKQHFSLFVGEKCHLIVLPSSWLHPAAATASGVNHIHIHGIIISLPTLSFAFQGLFPLIAHVISEE